MTLVLGIETSCDETGVAIVEDGSRIVVNEVATQADLHAQFGGVVPEIASREHTRVISQLTAKVLDAVESRVDAVAATNGPGLMGSLLVGVNFAKALAHAWGVPFVPVHHLEGHIYSAYLDGHEPEFPALALLVSGGHTSLILCSAYHEYEILGATRDDAVGESFDKVARLLDLPYPGGPSIERHAKGGDGEAFAFPRAMSSGQNLDFSYSGLKTAVLYALKKHPDADTHDVAASFQAAAIDVLLIKTQRALRATGVRRLIVAGGVAANALLRERVAREIDVEVLTPALDLCVDNGAMIAAAGYYLLQHGRIGSARTTPSPGLALC